MGPGLLQLGCMAAGQLMSYGMGWEGSSSSKQSRKGRHGKQQAQAKQPESGGWTQTSHANPTPITPPITHQPAQQHMFGQRSPWLGDPLHHILRHGGQRASRHQRCNRLVAGGGRGADYQVNAGGSAGAFGRLLPAADRHQAPPARLHSVAAAAGRVGKAALGHHACHHTAAGSMQGQAVIPHKAPPTATQLNPHPAPAATQLT